MSISYRAERHPLPSYGSIVFAEMKKNRNGKIRESYGGSAPKPPGKIKRFKPSLLSACREQQGGKNVVATRPPPAGAPDPFSLAQRMLRRNLGSYYQIAPLSCRRWISSGGTPNACNISMVCSPRSAAPCAIRAGVRLNRTGWPITRTSPRPF